MPVERVGTFCGLRRTGRVCIARETGVRARTPCKCRGVEPTGSNFQQVSSSRSTANTVGSCALLRKAPRSIARLSEGLECGASLAA